MTYNDFENKLSKCGLTKSEFAKIVGMNSTSVFNWSQGRTNIPAWVDAFFYYYAKAQKYDKIKNALIDELL